MSEPVFIKLVVIMYQVNKRCWKRMHCPSFENKMYPLSENSVHLVTYNADEIYVRYIHVHISKIANNLEHL